MRNSCSQTPTLSNSAEIVENESSYKLSPLLLNKERFLGWSKKLLIAELLKKISVYI